MSIKTLVASSLDQEMVNILASLAEEPSQLCASQKAPLSQSVILDQGTIKTAPI